MLHLELTALLLFVQTISFVFSLGHLLIKNLLLVVLEGTELLNLTVDHFLSHTQLISSTIFNSSNAHIVHFKLSSSEFFNTSFLSKFLLSGKLLSANLVGVCLHDVGLNASSLLLSLELANLLAFQVFFSLTLDQFTFEHLFLQLLNVVDLEFLELVGDFLCVSHLFGVLTFELGAHLLVILHHLFLFEILPVFLDVLGNCFLASFEMLLSLLFVHHIRKEQLGFERLHHVLGVVELTVSLFDLLTSKFILKLLFFGIHFSACDLNLIKIS